EQERRELGSESVGHRLGEEPRPAPAGELVADAFLEEAALELEVLLRLLPVEEEIGRGRAERDDGAVARDVRADGAEHPPGRATFATPRTERRARETRERRTRRILARGREADEETRDERVDHLAAQNDAQHPPEAHRQPEDRRGIDRRVLRFADV